MTTTIIGEQSRLEQKAAAIIESSIKKILKKNKSVVFAVPGGRSVSGIFKILKNKNISWKKVHIFMIDERLVSINNKESNFKLAKESFIGELIKKGTLPNENIHPFIFKKDKKDSGISDYEKELKQYGGRYDIILLSSGEDGHIGALYPHHHSISDKSKYYLAMSDSPKPPKYRMTMSKKLLLKSKVAILLFLGDAKREAYNIFLKKSININSCPTKLINLIKDSYVLTNLKKEKTNKIKKSEKEWKTCLTPKEFKILRKKGTELPFTGKYLHNKKKGIYTCLGCGKELFSSDTKFDSGSGWPSFFNANKTNLELKKDKASFMQGIEVLCKNCKGHLGHLFNDGPKPTGKRYCINSASLNFKEQKQKISKKDKK